jgi:hypothetical protein
MPAGLIEIAKDAAPRQSESRQTTASVLALKASSKNGPKRQMELLRAIYGLLRDDRLASNEAAREAKGIIPAF